MTTRTLTRSVTFTQSFVLAEMDEPQPAGTYIVETDEELIEGISFYAFRRILTLIHLHVKPGHPGIMQTVNIDPEGLEDALSRDVAPRKRDAIILAQQRRESVQISISSRPAT